MRWVPIHMDDNPVTIEGNNREVIEVGGEFGGFKENFNVHGKSFRLINLYASIIIYIGYIVNTSWDKNQKKAKVFLIEIESQQARRRGRWRPTFLPKPKELLREKQKAHRLSNQPAGHNERNCSIFLEAEQHA